MARTVNLGQIVPNIQIGETTTTSPSSSASVVNVGTELNPILNFSIPKGDTGATGPTGDTGANGLDAKINGVNTLTIEAGDNITLDQEGNILTINSTGGGSGGTSNYNALTNKPKINNVELNGNKSLNDLGIQPVGNYALESDMTEAQNDIDHLSKVSNLFEKITGTGTSVTLNDTSNTIMKLNLDTTTSSQNTPTGKNKLKLKNTNNRGLQTTLNDDGSISVSGTATETIAYIDTGENTNLVAGAYTFSIQNTLSVRTRLFLYNGSTQIGAPTIAIGSLSATLTTTQTITNYSLILLDLVVGNSYNFKIYPMLESGSSATSWEPYTGGNPAPSPSYPQTVHTITGDNEIDIVGKNLLDLNRTLGTPSDTTYANTTKRTFDFSKFVVGITGNNYYYSANITSYEVSNNNVKVKTVSGSNGFGVGFPIKVKANQSYKLSYSISESAVQNTAVGFYQSDGTYISFSTSTRTNNYLDITTPSNCDFMVVVFRPQSNTETTYSNIMLEYGTTSSPYQPYTSQTYPINLGSMELCKISDYKDVIFKNTINSEYYNSSLELNKWYKLNNIGKVVLDGSDTGIQSISSYDQVLSYTGEGVSFQASFSNLLTAKSSTEYLVISNYFNKAILNDRITKTNIIYSYADGVLRIATNITNKPDFKNWLSTHNTTVYYVLATPTYTLLNDTLQTQLDNLQYALAYDTQTNISQTNNDLPFIINAETYVDLTDYVKNTDYASSSKGGVIKTGYSSNVDANGNLYATNLSYTNYQNVGANHFISKGTLENVLRGYGIIE